MTDGQSLLLTLGAAGAASPVAAIFLAHYDTVFTYVPEGQIKVVMRGGDFYRFIPNIPNKIIDPATYNIVDGEEPANNWITELTGAYWVGVPGFRSILEYPFNWNQWTKKKGSTDLEMVPRDENTRTIMFRYPYGITYSAAEFGGSSATLNIGVVVTVEVVNPYTMLFGTQPTGKWIDRFTAAVDEVIRFYVAGKSFTDLTKEREAEKSTAGGAGPQNVSKKSGLSRRILMLGADPDDPQGLQQQVGVKIIDVDFVNVELVTDPRIKAALDAQMIAREEGKARIIAAQKSWKEKWLIGDGNAQLLQQETAALKDPVARRLRELQALEKASEKGRVTLIARDVDNVLLSVPAAGGEEPPTTGNTPGGTPPTSPQPTIPTTPKAPETPRTAKSGAEGKNKKGKN